MTTGRINQVTTLKPGPTTKNPPEKGLLLKVEASTDFGT